MNEERAGLCMRQIEHTSDHLWLRYSVTVDQAIVATANFQNDEMNLTTSWNKVLMYPISLLTTESSMMTQIIVTL
jgi:hypothetical protein